MPYQPPVEPIVPPSESGQAAWPVKRRTVTGGESASASPTAPTPIVPPGAAESDAIAERHPGSGVGLREIAAGALAGAAEALGRTLPSAEADEIDPNAARLRTRQPGIVLDCGATDDVRHVGVAFVHGIGSQLAGETLRDWGSSIVRVLADFRVDSELPADPVVTTQLDPTSGKTLFIEVALPAATLADGRVVPEEHWVLTEAWWAQRIAPPSFGQMAEWLGPGGAIRRILEAMFAAQTPNDPRQRAFSEAHVLERDAETEGTNESTAAMSMLERPISPSEGGMTGAPPTPGAGPALRPGPLAGLLEKLGAGLFLQAASTLLLLLYGALRSIEKLLPIGPLKNGALTRPIDNFVLEWFGDVHVLLGDPAQSASVRARLIDAIWDLEAIDCKPITIVAHSGGAIVTYLTLADPVTARLRVDRVVTHGEGANLAWRLTANGEVDGGRSPIDVYGDLYRSLSSRQRKVTWTDMWASQDPAPVGLLMFPKVDLPTVESIGVWNRLSFRNDHGTYWENDEEFVVPLLRRLVGSPDGESNNLNFGTDAEHELRSRKRRERVAVLSLWAQFCRALPTVAVLHAFAIQTTSVTKAGEIASAVWSVIPGHEIISGPVDLLRSNAPLPGSIGDWFAQLGVWVIAAILVASAIFSLRSPPERSALFTRTWYLIAIDAGYAVAWRVLVGYLVIMAAIRFTNPDFAGTEQLAGLVIGIALVIAGTEFAISQLLASGRVRLPKSLGGAVSAGRGRVRGALDRIPKGTTFALRTIGLAVALAITVVLVVSPFLAMAFFPNTANLVLGTVVIFVLFQVLLAVGQWRWNAWDARQRVDTRRPGYKGRREMAVAIQITIHVLAAVLLYLGIVWAGISPLGFSNVLVAAMVVGVAVLLGIGIDVATASRRRGANPGERVNELIRSKL